MTVWQGAALPDVVALSMVRTVRHALPDVAALPMVRRCATR